MEGRSFSYIKNSSGPRIEPWGTPEVASVGDYAAPMMVVHSNKKHSNTLDIKDSRDIGE
jgi:hypothetical protein